VSLGIDGVSHWESFFFSEFCVMGSIQIMTTRV